MSCRSTTRCLWGHGAMQLFSCCLWPELSSEALIRDTGSRDLEIRPLHIFQSQYLRSKKSLQDKIFGRKSKGLTHTDCEFIEVECLVLCSIWEFSSLRLRTNGENRWQIR